LQNISISKTRVLGILKKKEKSPHTSTAK
jgi:hypothetical protein